MIRRNSVRPYIFFVTVFQKIRFLFFWLRFFDGKKCLIFLKKAFFEAGIATFLNRKNRFFSEIPQKNRLRFFRQWKFHHFFDLPEKHEISFL